MTFDFVQTDIPNRLDRLPWSRWHAQVVSALAVTWLLDGLEGSLGGSLAGALKDPSALGFSDAQLGLSSSFYLGGAVLGALIFGYLADRFGRRKLFTWTLLLYVCATAATGLSWNLLSFTLFRALTGAGIGGEYAAINSAVDELVPARPAAASISSSTEHSGSESSSDPSSRPPFFIPTSLARLWVGEPHSSPVFPLELLCSGCGATSLKARDG